MPKRRSRGGRGTPRTSSAAAPPDIFDDAWLAQYRERQASRLIDLTDIEDRRRWHPDRMPKGGPAPLGARYRQPRIVIVPEGHKLARLAPYGGRVRAERIFHAYKNDQRTRRRSFEEFTQHERIEPRGRRYQSYGPDHFSHRVGFQHPWQVMICIRRKQRQQALFALGRAGAGSMIKRALRTKKKPRRNFWSEVYC